ncbi:hypothetical protein FRB94_001437 [Tulasnella sp. JGI-2019a]|nr:hypothetical protein FRB94_001437 [Tulasnella sp. JGI-2019a]KAG9006276.1 hypothetical protein FRB93_008765 [Tulasnella sp. JGI-2019a]KAG9037944.1 hypothetical protein FRB95_003337 [Tulasnella sp. JGI-2019a]
MSSGPSSPVPNFSNLENSDSIGRETSVSRASSSRSSDTAPNHIPSATEQNVTNTRASSPASVHVATMLEDDINTRASSPASVHTPAPKADSPQLAPTGVSRHPRWSKLNTASIQIEKTLYEIPLHLLMDSEYFKERLVEKGDGLIVIGDISVFEMDALLSILDARVVESNALTSLAYDHWAAILRLASLWHFSVVRSLAMEKFNTHFLDRDPLERLELALRCQVKQWIHPIYVQLCERTESISADEAERLGVARFAAIIGIREKVLRSKVPDSESCSALATTGSQVHLVVTGGGNCSGCGQQLHKVWVHKAHGHPLVADTCAGVARSGAAMATLSTKVTINVSALVNAAVELRVPF